MVRYDTCTVHHDYALSALLVLDVHLLVGVRFIIDRLGEEDAVPAAILAFVAVEYGSGSKSRDREVGYDVGALATRAESCSHTMDVDRAVLSFMRLGQSGELFLRLASQ